MSGALVSAGANAVRKEQESRKSHPSPIKVFCLLPTGFANHNIHINVQSTGKTAKTIL